MLRTIRMRFQCICMVDKVALAPTKLSLSLSLCRFLLQMFPVAEVVEFLEANETPRPVCLRANSLKVDPHS